MTNQTHLGSSQPTSLPPGCQGCGCDGCFGCNGCAMGAMPWGAQACVPYGLFLGIGIVALD